MIKLSDYLWERIADEGVRHVFMLPGGGAMHLVDSLGRSKRLSYIPLLHEQSCSFAAETYARVADSGLGVCCVTTGPGAANAVTGCAAAWLESAPVVFVSGQVKTNDLKGSSGLRQKGNQELGIVDVVSSIAKYAVTITDPATIAYHIDRAIYEARSNRPGPVWLDIPLDIQATMIEPQSLDGYFPVHTSDSVGESLRQQVDDIIALLRQAKRPVIVAGQGIERGGGREDFLRLINILEVPVLTSWIATDLIDADHICNLGKPGMVAPRFSNFTLQASDLVIAIGTRLDSAMIGYEHQSVAPSARKVIVDIDSAELDKFSFAIDQRVQMDATAFIRLLLERIKVKAVSFSFSDWLQQANSWKQQYPLDAEYAEQTYSAEQKNQVSLFRFFDELFLSLSTDDIVIPGSSGAAIDLFWLIARRRGQQRMLATGSLGSMGYGLAAAIGAHFASGKRIICVEGDGSLQLNIQELSVVSRRQLPLIIFVIDNGGYLSIRNMQDNHFGGHQVASSYESGLCIPNIESVAKGYGIETITIDSADGITHGIGEALEKAGPTLIVVKIASDLTILPKVASKVLPDGKMLSGNLEDMWPFLPEEIVRNEVRCL